MNRNICRAVGMIALLLAACGAPDNEATNENFIQVLNAHYTKYHECFPIGKMEAGQTFLFVVEVADDGKVLGAKRNARDLKPFLALARAGIMSVHDTTLELKNFSKTEQVPAKGFRLTKAGEAAIQPKALNRGPDKDMLQLCYGRRDIVEIMNFTAPVVQSSAATSHVKYRYRLAEVPEWAIMPELAPRLALGPAAIAGVSEDSDDLVLSDKGWVHTDEFK